MALVKPIANYDGELSVIAPGDAIDTTAGGTGLTSYTPGNYIRALNSSTLQEREPAQVAGDIGACRFTRAPTAPVSPNPGDEWLDEESGRKYTWVYDGDSGQWVEIPTTATVGSAAGSPVYIGNSPPEVVGTYFWIQTGLGDDGTDFTFWINEN